MSRWFDGSTGYLTNASAPVTAYPFSLTGKFFFEGASAGTQGGTILWIGDSTTFNTFTKLNVAGTSTLPINVWTRGGGAGVEVDSPFMCKFGVWHTVTAVMAASGNDSRLYIDGMFINKSTQTGDTLPNGTWNGVWIGAENEGALGAFVQGFISQCAVWNVALTDDEALSLYRKTPNLVHPSALVSYWPLKNGDLTDYAGTRNLTANGTTMPSSYEMVLPKLRPQLYSPSPPVVLNPVLLGQICL